LFEIELLWGSENKWFRKLGATLSLCLVWKCLTTRGVLDRGNVCDRHAEKCKQWGAQVVMCLVFDEITLSGKEQAPTLEDHCGSRFKPVAVEILSLHLLIV
jgi:hypothetical protein